jgi:hypothetical protein
VDYLGKSVGVIKGWFTVLFFNSNQQGLTEQPSAAGTVQGLQDIE